LKVSEYKHLKSCDWYSRFHRIVGGIGQCGSVTALFTVVSGFFDTGGGAGCGVGTVCLGLKIAGTVLLAVVSLSVALLTFYDPSARAEQNKQVSVVPASECVRV